MRGTARAALARPGRPQVGESRLALLFIWPAGRGEWVSCPAGEITWLDRSLLSGNRDVTLHRPPRCAGLRYVQHQWELFSRDTTHQVYLAPHCGPGPRDHRAVREAAARVLPVAPGRHFETLPVPLDDGQWLVSVGEWVVPLRVENASRQAGGDGAAWGDGQPPTQDAGPGRNGPAPGARPPLPDAVARARRYLDRSDDARRAMAYHFQEHILGLPVPVPVPMVKVAIALDLASDGAVSDVKRMLQDCVWQEQGHQRELADFLISNGLLTHADLQQAEAAAAANERSGRTEIATARLRYRDKKR